MIEFYRKVRSNWLTCLSIVLVFSVLVMVKQVRHLFELPTIVFGKTSLIALGFYGYLFALALLYLIVGGWVVPAEFIRKRRSVRPQTPADERTFRDWIQWFWGKIETHHIIFSVVTVIVSCGFALLGFLASPAWVYIFDRPILFTCSLLSLAASSVFLLWKKWDDRTRHLLMRTLTALIVLNLLGELIWWLAEVWPLFSQRNYSQWAIIHLSFVIILWARVVDFWQSYSEVPVRFLTLLVAVLFLGLMPPAKIGRLREFGAVSCSHTSGRASRPYREQGLESADLWLAYFYERLLAIDDDGPVILVAASGGGSRAAVFTALVYEDMRRAAVPVSCANREFHVNDHIALISSVSGGSLASACFLDEEYQSSLQQQRERAEPRNFSPEEVLQLMRDNLPKIRNAPFYQRTKKLNGSTEIINFTDAAADACDASNTSQPWCFRNRFVDDMCTDFMAPLLRGVLHPGRNRGHAVQRAWEQRFGMRVTNSGIHRIFEPTKPLLVCNVADIERGTRVMIGFPPLSPNMVGSGEAQPTRRINLTRPTNWTNLDSSSTSFVELTLAEAVRLSANFPWGFPVALTKFTRSDESGTETAAEVRLIDGGVVDNTGLDSIRHVIERLHGLAQNLPPAEKRKTTAPAELQRTLLAKKILDRLAERGVLILEIDSGAKPEKPGFITKHILSGILEPINALMNASYASASDAVNSHLDALSGFIPHSRSERLLRRIDRLGCGLSNALLERESNSSFPNVHRLTITCNHADNVMTAWALGPEDKAQIFLRFFAGSTKLRYELEDMLCRIHDQNSALADLETVVTQLEETPATDKVQRQLEVLDALNAFDALASVSQQLASAHQQFVELEKMHYQGVLLPSEETLSFLVNFGGADGSLDILQAARTDGAVEPKIASQKTEFRTFPLNISSPIIQADEPDIQTRKYIFLERTIDQLELNLKKRSDETIKQIRDMKSRTKR